MKEETRPDQEVWKPNAGLTDHTNRSEFGYDVLFEGNRLEAQCMGYWNNFEAKNGQFFEPSLAAHFPMSEFRDESELFIQSFDKSAKFLGTLNFQRTLLDVRSNLVSL